MSSLTLLRRAAVPPDVSVMHSELCILVKPMTLSVDRIFFGIHFTDGKRETRDSVAESVTLSVVMTLTRKFSAVADKSVRYCPSVPF